MDDNRDPTQLKLQFQDKLKKPDNLTEEEWLAKGQRFAKRLQQWVDQIQQQRQSSSPEPTKKSPPDTKSAS